MIQLRRLLLAPLAALVLVSGALALRPARVSAWEGWCEDDPIFLVAGQPLVLAVAVPQDALAQIDTAAQFVITVPANVDASVISIDPAFFPDSVTIRASGQPWDGKTAMPVEVSVLVPGSGSFPIQFSLTRSYVPVTNLFSGVSNTVISRQVELPASLWTTLSGPLSR